MWQQRMIFRKIESNLFAFAIIPTASFPYFAKRREKTTITIMKIKVEKERERERESGTKLKIREKHPHTALGEILK
jgi:hypothetical protein